MVDVMTNRASISISTVFGDLVARFDAGSWRSIGFDDQHGGPVAELAGSAGRSSITPDEARTGLVEARAELLDQFAAYEAGRLDRFDVPLHWDQLAAFQRAVLEATATVRYGETTTYGRLAAQVGRAGEARAVGRALRTNPWAVVVPCHRVVSADGSLTGYGGGPDTGGRLDRKAALLAHERQRREPSLF